MQRTHETTEKHREIMENVEGRTARAQHALKRRRGYRDWETRGQGEGREIEREASKGKGRDETETRSVQNGKEQE